MSIFQYMPEEASAHAASTLVIASMIHFAGRAMHPGVSGGSAAGGVPAAGRVQGPPGLQMHRLHDRWGPALHLLSSAVCWPGHAEAVLAMQVRACRPALTAK